KQAPAKPAPKATKPAAKAPAKAPAKPAPKAAPKAAKAPAKAAAASKPAKPAPKATKAPAKPPKAAKPAPSAPPKAPEPAEPAEPSHAERILASEAPAPQIAELGAALLDASSVAKATQAAKVLAEIAAQRIELLTPQVDKFAKTIASKNKRVAQTAADALPGLARVAPARVARHLDPLRAAFAQASPVGKDGLVRTFAALCTASVAYQKRRSDGRR